MTGLLIQLADLGVTGVRIYYSGGGDSGCIEDILYTTEILSKDEDEAFEHIADLSGPEPDLKKINKMIADQLEDFVISKILDHIEDWWNDDGGYGTLSILVPSGKYKIHNTVYYTNTKDYVHEDNLLNKTIL